MEHAFQLDWIFKLVFLFKDISFHRIAGFSFSILDGLLRTIGMFKSDIGLIQNCSYKRAQGTLFVQLTVNNDVMLVLEDKALVKTLIKRMRLNL